MNLTDDEMRVKCAEAMGCKWIKSGKYRIPTFDPVIAPECYQAEEMADGSEPIGNLASKLANIPNYSTSVDAALTLCDRLRSEGWRVKIKGDSLTQKGDKLWQVWLHGPDFTEWDYDPSLARAICLAFLRVMEGRGE